MPPLQKVTTKKGLYWFDDAAADRVCEFFEQCLKHSKGEWQGQPFILQDWQRHHLRQLFGWKRRNGQRRFTRTYWEIPRKNGKSTLAAGVVCYLATSDGEPGAEVYTAANDKTQAKIVFTEAARMWRQSPVLGDLGKVYDSTATIVVPTTLSYIQALSSESKTKDGLNPHGLVIDELHEMNDRPLLDKLTSAQGARRQPLTFMATTAGSNLVSICYEKRKHAINVLTGAVEDDQLYAVVYGADEKDDWHSVETWKKANPGYGVSAKEDRIREAYQEAISTPSEENKFKRYHLNIWTEQAERWLSLDPWDACAGTINLEELVGWENVIGLDLGSTNDLAAAVHLFRDPTTRRVVAIPRFWLPEENIESLERRHNVPYRAWAKQGFITLTRGSRIDYRYIEDTLLELDQKYSPRSIGFDPWNAQDLCNRLLEDHGLPMVVVRQGFATMSPASKETERMIVAGEFIQTKHPILRWHLANVAIVRDRNENIMPTKEKSAEKIDGAVALIIAVSRLMSPDDGRSVYEDREPISLE
ncbi:MAG: terminase large subunit [Phycisphaerales bacterium]|nr:terminase large subunit [Phycisphaerales bacterium]